MDVTGIIGDDRGFTLVELVIGLSLFVVVTTVVSQLLWLGVQSNRAAMSKAAYTTEVSEPLGVIDRNLMQATSLESASAYAVTFLVNPNLDESYQRMAVDLTGSKGRIRIWNTNDSLANTTLVTDRVFTSNLVNQPQSVPAFRYYDANGAEMSDYTSVPARAKSVKVAIRISISGTVSERAQDVQLRNMFGY